MIHQGIKYKAVPVAARGTQLYIWVELTEEYIFERTLHGKQTAEQAIDQLIEDGFLKKG